jgi:predicted HAD superfamily Cof-like phosphohydrolase
MTVLEQVKEFHLAFGHPVKETPQVPVDRVKLRLSLLLEELHELAVASGQEGTFNKLLGEKLGIKLAELLENNVNLEDTNISNIVECVDAFADIDYVLKGAMWEYGVGNVMVAASDNVHASNMSKLCTDLEQVERTISKYDAEGVDTYFKEVVVGVYAIYRASDNKILKSIDYTPANLKDIVFNNSNNDE